MIWTLVLVPGIAGFLAFLLRSDRPRRILLLAAALAHAVLTAVVCLEGPQGLPGDWLRLDELGVLFLPLTSALFLAAAWYGVDYLAHEVHGPQRDPEEGALFSNEPEAIFIGCLLFFLTTMTLVILSQHFGLLWVSVEATTLVSAPLIYFHRHHRSLEATWKYLLVCSVGIALALLGTFLLALAASRPGCEHVPLLVQRLMDDAGGLRAEWLKVAFVFFLIGYGTKMGLAPLHTWLPDAHSEAPSVVSALLSGALLNCAFLGILRVQQVCVAAGEGAFGRDLLVLFGLLSMGLAAVFILRQPDFKRLLAYSSVEHMGIMALGVGLGGVSAFGAFLHALNHSLTKGMLFLIAGNILVLYRTKAVADVRGVWRVLPVSGALWMLGFLALTGSPPFGPFLSEFTILKGALEQGRGAVAVAYLFFLALAFVGMASAILPMAQGAPREFSEKPSGERLGSIVPPALLGAFVLMLGVYVPEQLQTAIQTAARAVGGP